MVVNGSIFEHVKKFNFGMFTDVFLLVFHFDNGGGDLGFLRFLLVLLSENFEELGVVFSHVKGVVGLVIGADG